MFEWREDWTHGSAVSKPLAPWRWLMHPSCVRYKSYLPPHATRANLSSHRTRQGEAFNKNIQNKVVEFCSLPQHTQTPSQKRCRPSVQNRYSGIPKIPKAQKSIRFFFIDFILSRPFGTLNTNFFQFFEKMLSFKNKNPLVYLFLLLGFLQEIRLRNKQETENTKNFYIE